MTLWSDSGAEDHGLLCNGMFLWWHSCGRTKLSKWKEGMLCTISSSNAMVLCAGKGRECTQFQIWSLTKCPTKGQKLACWGIQKAHWVSVLLIRNLYSFLSLCSLSHQQAKERLYLSLKLGAFWHRAWLSWFPLGRFKLLEKWNSFENSRPWQELSQALPRTLGTVVDLLPSICLVGFDHCLRSHMVRNNSLLKFGVFMIVGIEVRRGEVAAYGVCIFL